MDNPRREEQFAKEAFSRFLAGRHSAPPEWEPGSEPPDFWLNLGGRRLAVEVTQLMEWLDVGPPALTTLGANVSLTRTIQQLRLQAQAAGLLRGFYHIHVCPLPDLRRILPDLQTRLFAYLQDTAADSAAERRELWRGRYGQRWMVEKVHANSDALAESMSLGSAKLEGEVREELSLLLSTSLADKREKVRAIREEVIMLLVDAYHYADGVDWLRAAIGLDTSPSH